ncbi:hypothetical protein [Clostridium sp.]|uniref:hypothetical protein n=1 Tax=Clostridium sp. TaxID=1506 RepID=UPI003D6D6B25
MLFGLFKNRENKPVKHEECYEIMPYDVLIATNFNDQDRKYMNPIYTVKYYSKLKSSINEAVFCKNPDNLGITLNQAFLTVEEILKQSIEDKLLISTITNQNGELTYDERIAIDKLELIVKH